MRTISADYIFPISSAPIKNGIVIIDNDGTILDIEELSINHQPSTINHYNGVVCPGFINTHCHLELSYLKGHLSEKAGMTGFIREIMSKRDGFRREEIIAAIAPAEQEMINEGIVAVGDISNDDFTFEQKGKGNLIYHTFLEVFDFTPHNAEKVVSKGKILRELLQRQASNIKHQTSISPHAPYTLSAPLARLISQASEGNILSIHNQESAAENEFFISKSGPMKELYDKAGINTSHFDATGKNSLHYILENLSDFSKLLLVHNTYTSREDLQYANSKQQTTNNKLFWATCPNANLYIENKLPDYNTFIAENARLTIGTDSYASNHALSILSEIKTISNHFPAIELNTLLTWATINGAEFLGLEKSHGTLEKGKRPGLVHISGLDLNTMRLTEKSKAKKI